jgi:hypothetical protein
MGRESHAQKKAGTISVSGVKLLTGLSRTSKLPPLLDGHREEQLRIASPGLSLLWELAFAVLESGEDLSATELATLWLAQIPGGLGSSTRADDGHLPTINALI